MACTTGRLMALLGMLGAAAACGRAEPATVPEIRGAGADEPDVAGAVASASAPEVAVAAEPEVAGTGTGADTGEVALRAQNMGWVVVRPPGAGFQLELPSEPRFEEKVVTGPTGLSTIVKQWNGRDDVAGTLYVVAVTPLVEQLVQFGDAELALDRTLEAVTKVGMRIDKTSRIQLEGFSGRQADVTILAPEGEVPGRVRLYLVGMRLFQLIAAWGDERGRTQVEKFFVSLVFDDDVASREAEPVDLWRRFAAPGGALDLELPGEPDRSVVTRDTPFGHAEVGFVTLLSAFPPAVYAANATPLGEAERAAAVTTLFDRWQASLDGTFTARHNVEVLGGPARRLERDGAARLAFVHDGTFYELSFQAIAKPGEAPAATARERDRFFASPRALAGAATSDGQKADE